MSGIAFNPVDRLANGDGFLTRSDLAAMGLPRRAIDACFRSCPVVALPGFSRPMLRVADFQRYIEANTYCGDRVRPCR